MWDFPCIVHLRKKPKTNRRFPQPGFIVVRIKRSVVKSLKIHKPSTTVLLSLTDRKMWLYVEWIITSNILTLHSFAFIIFLLFNYSVYVLSQFFICWRQQDGSRKLIDFKLLTSERFIITTKPTVNYVLRHLSSETGNCVMNIFPVTCAIITRVALFSPLTTLLSRDLAYFVRKRGYVSATCGPQRWQNLINSDANGKHKDQLFDIFLFLYPVRR